MVPFRNETNRLVVRLAAFALALAALSACATNRKMSSARPIGNGPYLSDQDGGSWWDTRSTSQNKSKTYRR